MHKIYLTALDELSKFLESVPNTSMAAYLRVIHLMSMNIRYEKIAFNRAYRLEVLGAYSFASVEELSTITEDWPIEYDQICWHEAFRGLAPRQFALHLP